MIIKAPAEALNQNFTLRIKWEKNGQDENDDFKLEVYNRIPY